MLAALPVKRRMTAKISLIITSLLWSIHFLRYEASGCDLVFTSATGNFTSPGFPSTALLNKQCSYSITVPVGKTIQVNFVSLDLGRLGCTYAELKVYEGTSATGQPALTKCGTSRDPYISQGNRLYIAFKATYMTGSGFHIAFAARNGCAMVFESDEGTFTSPRHPLNYPPSMSCSYQISGPVGTRISLIFSKFTLESSADCSKDSLAIYEGTDGSGTLVGRKCGTNTTQFLSQRNNLYLQFSSDGSGSAEGFRIFYVASKLGCDRVFSDPSGNITSPDYPSLYPSNGRCIYKINAPTGSIIHLEFLFFSLTGYGDMDRLKIYEGIDESGLLTDARRWAINYPYLSTGNNLALVFTTDSTGTSNGFKIRYTTLPGCNIRLTSINGMFTSPLYPHPYANQTSCNYTISLQKGRRIHLFFQKFELENSGSCRHDSLKIYEGSNMSSPLAEAMCGIYKNKQFISADNELFLQLKTNERLSGAGFLANYYTTALSCNGVLSGPSGTIKSPNFPNNYPNNAQCTYEIRGKTGSKIQLIFSHFSISKSSSCRSDSFKVYEESGSPSSLISSRCGNETSSLVSSASKLYIIFKSDMTMASTGFAIYYQIGPRGCGGVFSGTEGTITSPGILGKYPNNALCRYTISAPAGKKISLIFSAFALQYDKSCRFDSLRIYEGNSETNGTLRATRCGSDVTSMVSNSNELFLVFATDGSDAMAGFTITFITGDEGCNKKIRQASGSISSPLSPSPYPNNAFCTYLIEVPADQRVELTFQRFMLASCCSGRECDTLKIYDGLNAKSALLKTFCGLVSEKVTSSSNLLYLEFKSDGTIPNYGFQATFKSVGPGSCMKLKPCRNNGTCIDLTESTYKCNCLPRYTGSNCTAQFLPCSSNPCRNGGRCINRYESSSASFECICKDGFTGDKCQTKFDECEGYVADNRWQRSIGNKIKVDSAQKYCDNSLSSNWYRFLSNAGPDMPTTCPPMYSCGTIGGVWANGTFPRKADEYVNITACVRDETGCCSSSWAIRVKKCFRNATTFNVYRLTRPPSCPMAYCAGTEVPCPDGWNSPNGFTPGCTNNFPKILSKPEIKPAVKGNNIEFTCSFSSETNDDSARFEVTWYEGLPLKQINKTDILRGKERIAKLINGDPQKPLFRLGTTIFCRIHSWHASKTYAVVSSPVYESNHYYAGVKVMPEKTSYSTTEASKPIKLSVVVTVPIVCPSSKPCRLRIQLDQDNPDAFLSACVVEFQPGKANQSKTIEIVAKRDFINDGTQRVTIRIRIIEVAGLPDWDNHHGIKDIIIIIIDIHTERCTSSGDPHLISFDKLYFNHYKLGDYVLVNSTCREFEVHVRTWKCAAVTCNCGVAAREGNDVIVVDMCRDGVPRARFASKRTPAEGTTLTRDKSGKSFIIRFPSGAYVRMDNYRWYGNVYYANVAVQVPSDDFNCTVGLCGTFDRNKHNDMTSKDGKIYTTMDVGFQAPVGFTESWRIPVGKSLFYYKDKGDPCKSEPRKNYCICTLSSSNKVNANCGYKSAVKRPVYSMVSQGWSKLSPSSFKSCGSRKRRAIASETTLPNYDADLDYIYDPPQLASVSITWPTKTGKTKSQVEAYCRTAVATSEPGKICSGLSDFSYSPFILQCVEDVQITDNFAFSISAIRSMQDACEEIFLKNTTYWKADPANNGTIGPPMEVARTLCPGLCSGHGICVNATCICERNYTSVDCSVDKRKGPSLLSIASGGLCDVRKSNDCEIVRMVGYDFMEASGLSCRATRIRVSNSGYTLTDQKTIIRASLLSFGEIICPLKILSIKINGDAKISTGTPINAYVIDASNDGVVYSKRKLPYLVYDSKCLECNGTTGSCSIRSNTCRINGYCFNAGEGSVSDKCSKCDPRKSQINFSRDSSCDGEESNILVIAVSVSAAVILGVILFVVCLVEKKKMQSKDVAPSIDVQMKEMRDNISYKY